MKFNRIIIIILILTISVLINTSSADDKAVLLDKLDVFENKLEWLYYRLSLEQWDYYTTGQADSMVFYEELYQYLLSDSELKNDLTRAHYRFDSDSDQRRFNLIKYLFKQQTLENSPAINKLRDSLSNIDIHFRAEFENEQHSAGDLYRIYRSDANPVRREAAYRGWCAVGTELHNGLSRLFRMRNSEAKRNGYNNYMSLAFSKMNLDLEEYKSLLNNLKSISETQYLSILREAQLNYGRDNLEIWDLAYTYNNINSQVDSYFPVDSQLLFIKRSFKDIGFNLDDLPIYYDLEARADKSQLAYGFTIKAAEDMRVLANLHDGIHSTRVLLHEIGHTLHSAFIKQDRALFANVIDGVWQEGMAQIIASMMDEKEWLVNYAHLPEQLIDKYFKAKKEKDIIYLRTTLLRLIFELEAYKNPNRDLNDLYWKLFEEIMFLPRHDDIYPWAALIYYTTHPVYLQNYLYADMITAQTRKFMRDNYGNLTGNSNTKPFLVQNFFRFGGRYEWRELLKRGTDSELSSDYLIKHLGL